MHDVCAHFHQWTSLHRLLGDLWATGGSCFFLHESKMPDSWCCCYFVLLPVKLPDQQTSAEREGQKQRKATKGDRLVELCQSGSLLSPFKAPVDNGCRPVFVSLFRLCAACTFAGKLS
ncbi:unnamed protein product [Ectocarpus sp. 13 AM-2016]